METYTEASKRLIGLADNLTILEYVTLREVIANGDAVTDNPVGKIWRVADFQSLLDKGILTRQEMKDGGGKFYRYVPTVHAREILQNARSRLGITQV